MKPSPFIQQLRNETAAKHEMLEQLPLSSSLMSPHVTIHQYTEYLKEMLPVMHDIEENIFPIIQHLITDVNQRNKTQLILHDLNLLETSIQPNSFPLTEKLKEITIPFALGMTYVTEGSTLGGRVILKHLVATAIPINNATRFFHGYGDRTGPMWTGFIDQLSQYENETGTSKEIIAGANHCFDAIHKHFQATVAQ